MTSIPWAIVLANYLDYAITLVVAVLALLAVLDCLRRSAVQFERAWKRTKTFWSALLGVAAVLGFVGLYPPLGGGYLGLMALFLVTPAIIYLTDVRPALGGFRGSRGPRGGSRGPGSRGGW